MCYYIEVMNTLQRITKLKNSTQYIIMIVLVAIMVATAFYIWNEDRKLPKVEKYGYEAFTAEDFEYWMQ